jgi:hypothetical protein
MYFDSKPCAVCGSEVRLEPHRPPDDTTTDGPVGPPDGVVGTADPTVDDRVCTNPDCPTHESDTMEP